MKDLNPEIVRVCQVFSEGNPEPIMAYLPDDVVWSIMGETTIRGIDDFRDFCSEMHIEDGRKLKNNRVTVGQNQVIIEGSDDDPEEGIAYCDSYTVNHGKVTEIRSYCISFDEEYTED